jgi:hypothetical protein
MDGTGTGADTGNGNGNGTGTGTGDSDGLWGGGTMRMSRRRDAREVCVCVSKRGLLVQGPRRSGCGVGFAFALCWCILRQIDDHARESLGTSWLHQCVSKRCLYALSWSLSCNKY